MTKNLVMMSDSYKYSHRFQYPKNTIGQYNYMESRGGVYPKTVVTGMTGFIKEYLLKPITIQDVNQAAMFAEIHGIPFDREGWEYIVTEHNGFIPVEIKTVKEGSVIPVKNVIITVKETDPKVAWIVGWFETLILKLWYPITVATKAYYMKKILLKYGSPEWADFAYVNFGDRGSTSVESAAIGGFAHSTSFMATDNFNSLLYSFENYGANPSGYSIFATEHSTTTSNAEGSQEKEKDFVLRMLKENPKEPLMAFVADSYNVYNFVEFVTSKDSEIRQIIEERENQTLILRPDSGDPIKVITKIIDIMEKNEIFDIEIGGRKASSNFKLLWGDGVTPGMIDNILSHFTELGYAAEFFVFGSGGDIMQNVNRDTMKFAIKCSSIDIQEEDSIRHVDVFKDPITDPGKTSKKGKVTLYNIDGKYITDVIGAYSSEFEVLETVYKNGELIKSYSMDEVRENINS